MTKQRKAKYRDIGAGVKVAFVRLAPGVYRLFIEGRIEVGEVRWAGASPWEGRLVLRLDPTMLKTYAKTRNEVAKRLIKRYQAAERGAIGSYGEKDKEKRSANARLIAAAPELLKELQDIITAIKAGIKTETMLEMAAKKKGSSYLEHAEAAIAKAEGGEW